MRAVHYHVLAAALGFYLLAQTVQVVLHWTILPAAVPLDEYILNGQHPLNYLRLVLVLASMFVMVPGFLVLALSFYRELPLRSIAAAAFFLFFCLFEVAYRSIELFQVIAIWGPEYAAAAPPARVDLLFRFQIFYDAVTALYFPLLVSLMISSACLFAATVRQPAHRLIAIAMGIHTLQQVARLASYAGVDALDAAFIVTYYPTVAIVFGATLVWALRRAKSP